MLNNCPHNPYTVPMRRYLVQVVDEEDSANESSKSGETKIFSPQPAQSAQPVSSDTSSSSGNKTPSRRFVVETVRDKPPEPARPKPPQVKYRVETEQAPAIAQEINSGSKSKSLENNQSDEGRVVADKPPRSSPSSPNTHPSDSPPTDSPPNDLPPTDLPLTKTPASASKPKQSPSPVSEPPDYWESRQSALNKLWRQDRIRGLPESPAVKRPRHERENDVKQSFKKISPSKAIKLQNVERIERFYQNRVKPAVLKASAPSKPALWQRHRWLIGLSAAVIFIGGSIWLSVMAVKAEVSTVTVQVESLAEDLRQNRLISANERYQILDKKLDQYQQIYRFIRPAVAVTQGSEKTTHIDRLLEVSDQSLEIVNSGLVLYADLDRGYRQFVGEAEGESVETFTHLSGQFEGLFTQLAKLQTELSQLGNPYELELLSKLDHQIKQELPDLRKSVLTAQKVSMVLPELLGEDSTKTYLVLLQNNAELRPTGGFIGSFALLTIKDGKLLDFKVEDVYEADGQLNGFVTPPEEIVQYLGEEQWFLRDVNWSPDFPTVAQRASWFLDKSMGVEVDGVVAINLNVAQRLMEVTGPLQVVDYNEVITADNLYEQAQKHSEINFFPGSNGKKDFLSAVSTQILNQVFYGDTNKIKLAQALVDSAESAELFLSFSQADLEETFSTLGWNGELRTPACPAVFSPENCFVDTVMQVEANVGVNKANQFVSRTIDHQVEILGDRARHTRTIGLQNSSQSEAWPAGKYKTYLRLYVSQGSELRSLSVNGQPVNLQTVRSFEEEGKQVFGHYVEVPIKGEVVVTAFYEVPLSPQLKTYALFEQKQSGTSGDEVVHVIDVGERSVSTVAPEPQIDNRQLRFSSDHSAHQFIGVEF